MGGQLVTQAIGGVLVAQPSAVYAAAQAGEARPAQAGDGDQAPEACCIHFELVPFAPGWVLRSCDTHRLTLPAKTLGEARGARLSCETRAARLFDEGQR